MFRKLDEKSLYRLIFLDGIFLIGFSIYNYVSGRKFPAYETHSGLNWFLFNLEFSSNYEHITNLVGKVGDEVLTNNLNTLLQILELDYLYIFIYSIYFLGIFEISSKLFNPPTYIKAGYYFLMIIIILLDIFQNIILTEILNSNLSNPRLDYIYYLPRVSILLWNLIFFNLSMSGILIWLGTTELQLRIISLFFFLPPIFSIFSLLGRLDLVEVGLEVAVPGMIGFFLQSAWKIITGLLTKRNMQKT